MTIIQPLLTNRFTYSHTAVIHSLLSSSLLFSRIVVNGEQTTFKQIQSELTDEDGMRMYTTQFNTEGYSDSKSGCRKDIFFLLDVS